MSSSARARVPRPPGPSRARQDHHSHWQRADAIHCPSVLLRARRRPRLPWDDPAPFSAGIRSIAIVLFRASRLRCVLVVCP